MKLSFVTAANAPKSSPGTWRQHISSVAQWIWLHPWIALPLLAIPCVWPFFHQGLPHSADGPLHLLRLMLLDYHIQHGTFYPRWVPELMMGLGYPVFSFYSPATYYLADFFRLFGASYPMAFMLALSTLVVVAGAGMYLLAQDVFGSPLQRWAALLAATAYMAAPYLLTNVYVRGAIAEVGAQALLPWVLWSLRRLLTSDKPENYVLPVALSLGCLAITHNITLLLVPPVLIGYAVILWWKEGHTARRLTWTVVAVGAGASLSAFFWMPVLLERGFLSEAAYRISTTYLPENLWSWRNFLDLHLFFEYTFSIPFQLGLVQISLALIGLVVARRRDLEWLFFLGVAVLSGLAMGRWSESIWLGNRLLLIAQFPWRLLTFMSAPLAIFTGAIVVRLRRDGVQAVLTIGLLALILIANRPRVDWMPHLADSAESIVVPSVAQFERETGALGTSSASEFMPRWSQTTEYVPANDPLAASMEVTPRQAGTHSLEATVSTSGGPLRFATLFFPGWRVLLNGVPVTAYPSTILGLLTIDVPPGSHDLRVTLDDTPVRRLAGVISLITLAALVLFVWFRTQHRWLAMIPGFMLLISLVAVAWPPETAKLSIPAQPIQTEAISMIGYHTEPGDGSSLYVRPFWYVSKTPSPTTRIRWQLQDSAGNIVSEITARPYFNSQEANNWPPGSVVDDSYRLPFPGHLPSGDYELSAEVIENGDVNASGKVGVVSIEAPKTVQPEPSHPLDINFADAVTLRGFDLNPKQGSADDHAASFQVVRPGDTLEYTLYWQALQSLSVNYHGFVHLLDHAGQTVNTQDHLAGSFFRAPMLWDMFTVQPDRYQVRIPKTTRNGLYTPVLGLYDFKSLERIEAFDGAGQPLGDAYKLPPVKVLGKNPTATPQYPVNAKLGDTAILLGYDLAAPETGLRSGATFNLTLYYRSLAPTSQDLTQFVHLYDSERGMAAQHDSPPLQGANPTWAWVPGEVITDTIPLTIASNALPGVYRLGVGLYNPSDSTRLLIRSKDGELLTDGQIPLTDLTVQP